MKGWKIVKPFTLKEEEILETDVCESFTKVKITKSIITLSDVLRYKDELDGENVVLGSAGIGVVSEAKTNLFGLEKGKHVYIEPYREETQCDPNVNWKTIKGSSLSSAGIDFDGFLSDFASVDPGKLFILPDSVPDLDALFINHISLAISVVDKLEIQKGDYVAIVGGNNFANILAQLLIYYQAVPILITNNDEDAQIAKDSGVYYVLGADDNWQKEVHTFTSGRMVKSVVYVADCNIPVIKAFNLASHNASVAFTGVAYKNNAISFSQAIKKQLKILCINNGYGNTASSINLIANKAINVTHLKLDSSTYENVPKAIENMSKTLDEKGKIYETVIDLV